MNTPRWLRTLAHLNRLAEVGRCVRRFRHPLTVLGRYLQLGKPAYPCELRTRNGRRLEMTSYHDLVTAWVIFCREEYRLSATAHTILDIGANYGAFSLWAADRALTARIVAVEPFPDCHARLLRHVQSNALDGRIEAWNVGLSERSEQRYVSADTAGDPSLPSQSRAFVGDAQTQSDANAVQVFSMEDLVNRACEKLGCEELDFVKLDVEGVEHAAVTAAAVPALRRVRALDLEYHPNGSKAALFAVLQNAGLRCLADLAVHADSGVARFGR